MLNLLTKISFVFFLNRSFFFTLHEVQKDIYRSANKNNEVDVIYGRQVSEDYGFMCTTVYDSFISYRLFLLFFTKCELCHMCAHSMRKMLNYVRWKWNLSETFRIEKVKTNTYDLIFVLPYNQKSAIRSGCFSNETKQTKEFDITLYLHSYKKYFLFV